MKIADRSFERRLISDEVTLLYEPHVHPFLRCNIWHVRGRERDLLIDTGLGVASLRDAIADMIDKPLVAAATHIHYDHVGGLHEFDERLMHRVEAPRMVQYEEFAFLKLSDFGAELAAMMRVAGFDDLMLDAAPAGFDPDLYAVPSTTITRAVEEGDVVDLGDRHFEVLHLPGHSPGSIGLWEAATGTLFSGDAVYDGLLLDQLEDSNVVDYVSTMKRLRELPVTVVHGGHEPSFGRDRLIEIVDEYLVRRG